MRSFRSVTVPHEPAPVFRSVGHRAFLLEGRCEVISAYPIGGKVWLVRTEKVADDRVPHTLPMGSIVLTPAEAHSLIRQLYEAEAKAKSRVKATP